MGAGRKKSDNPKSARVNIRLTEEEYKILSDYSQSKNQTITKSLKEAIHLLFKREGSL